MNTDNINTTIETEEIETSETTESWFESKMRNPWFRWTAKGLAVGIGVLAVGYAGYLTGNLLNGSEVAATAATSVPSTTPEASAESVDSAEA